MRINILKRKGLGNFRFGGIFPNLFLALCCYAVCQLVFALSNWNVVCGQPTIEKIAGITLIGMICSVIAVVVTNFFYVILALAPLVERKPRGYNKFLKWLFVTINGFCMLLNLSDMIFFKYTQRRFTSQVFSEFGNETNLWQIILSELKVSWWVIPLFVLLIWILIRFYRSVESKSDARKSVRWAVWGVVVAGYSVLFVGLCSGYVKKRVDSMLEGEGINHFLLPYAYNSPLLLITSAFEPEIEVPSFFMDENEMSAFYNPIHLPKTDGEFLQKNVVIVIVESLSKRIVGRYEQSVDGQESLTPFIDSLIDKSVTFKRSYANGNASVDALPAIMSSIPNTGRSFATTSFVYNELPSLPKELARHGYESAFFHGGNNNTLGFRFYTERVGIDHYFGLDEYMKDSQTGGYDDFDGTWAIFDGPFLQFASRTISELKEPFMATIFTATSHHPYVVPEEYAERFSRAGESKIENCFRYTDSALKEFFESASREPWFDNTIFVVCADHTSRQSRGANGDSPLDFIEIPIIIYEPEPTIPPGVYDGVIQQIDIMPTILSMLRHDESFFAFGKNALDENERKWAIKMGKPIYYIEGNNAVMLRGDKILSSFVIKSPDAATTQNNRFRRGRHGFRGRRSGVKEEAVAPSVADSLQIRAKAIIQTIATRIKDNRLTVE